MKFGLYLPSYGAFGDARLLGDLAHEAEKAGWDGMFLWDHIALLPPEDSQLNVVDPWVALAVMAAKTDVIRLGATVTPIPRRRPHKLARETASIDRLSNGRFILGVGIGLGSTEWDHLGEEPSSRIRGEMLDESLDVLIGLWSGEVFNFTGKYYQVHEAQFLPTPVQIPHVPIWVGGFWPNRAPFRRMARWDGMFPIIDASGSEEDALFREAVEYVKAIRQKNRVDTGFDVVKMGITPTDDPNAAAQTVQSAAKAGATWWLELLLPEVLGFANGDTRALDPLRDRVPQGPEAMGWSLP